LWVQRFKERTNSGAHSARNLPLPKNSVHCIQKKRSATSDQNQKRNYSGWAKRSWTIAQNSTLKSMS
jgi:hypothetical protein